MTEVEIYYFSGTGNSLYVAKELQKRIPKADLIPVVSLLNKDVIETSGETVGFVFPIHFMTVPIPVKRFIKKLDLKSARYIFAVATRTGTQHIAFIEIEKILKKRGKSLNSSFTLNMGCNDPRDKDYHPVTKGEIAELESEVQKRLDSIKKIIINQENSREKDSEFIPASSGLGRLVRLGMAYAEHNGAKNYFYADSRCMGCGKCEKVCLSGKIKMIDNKPVWQESVKCYFCYACLNYCPAKAVQIKSKLYMKSHTEENERYSHPYATADEIAEQKSGRK
ncbi:ferredoxin [Methanosarcina sp. MSH10X1]|uniref:EFR1 family ferrodoxin n=1 Tax=Methanosarcina sp. MSH10X1 TaxID=2507075 RepID=UPI000FFC7C18|nr:EFR1 family ferrodoxin [Methanosarcina sp. MSH10X1]RXA14366.1 ferredoxin [Methanosarcina sp. MSH10X1]